MTTAAKTAASRLADIAGAANVKENPAELSAYAVDGKTPSAMVRPGTAEEVAEVVRFAAAEKLALIACGARTKLGMGLPPRQYDVAVDMTRMDRVVACDPGDLTVGVEAGIPLQKLGATLAEHKLFLPMAVPYAGKTTVGGTVASGVDNPLRQRYGTARDYLLGVEFVTGDGVAAKSGGRVVKNVSGYDLHKLMIGSLGTLGIMTRLNFRTYPMPVRAEAMVARFAQAPQALRMREKIAKSALTPSTLEIFSQGAAELLSGETARKICGDAWDASVVSNGHWMVTVGFSGSDAVRKRYAGELKRFAEEAGAERVNLLERPEEVRAAFSRKREFIPIALETAPATTILKFTSLPTKIGNVLERAKQASEKCELPWVAMARGVGVTYVVLLAKSRDEESRQKVNAMSASMEEHFTIPWCPTEWKSSLPISGNDSATQKTLPLMEKVKKVFDPAGILSPGRFMGGL
jgi:glycolate oxidase FAD binding subunit